MVGKARFELATPCSQSKCSSQAELLPAETITELKIFPQKHSRFPERLRAMTHPVLDLQAELAKRLLVTRSEKKRIVSEPILPLRFKRDGSPALLFDEMYDATLVGYRDRADEGRPPFDYRNIPQEMKYLTAICSVAF